MHEAAEAIRSMGAQAVFVKGGHLEDAERADDLFVDGGGARWVQSERIATPHTHGTGCVLSSAIAAHLARGFGLAEAVELGKAFVTQAIRHALAIGRGIGPVDPLFAAVAVDAADLRSARAAEG
jgi:hydroxymethylpyrimidine/phosphomethylpyrimidine kinase